MWVDDKLADDGKKSTYMMWRHEIHVIELPIETNFQPSVLNFSGLSLATT